MSIYKKTKTTIYNSKKQAPLLYHNKHMFFALDLQNHKNVTIILRFPKNTYFLERCLTVTDNIYIILVIFIWYNVERRK